MLNLFWVNLIVLIIISQKGDHDPRLFGKWILLYSMNANGEIIKDEFYGKKYIEEYTQDGRLILDPNFLLDDMKRRGKTMPLDYAAIPTFQWRTINKNTLRIDFGDYGTRENRYGFLGDTLIFGFPDGHTRFLLKRK